jgi:hypothetical protein
MKDATTRDSPPLLAEVRQDARAAIGTGALSSIKSAFAFFGGITTTCGLVGGGIAALGRFTPPVMAALTFVSIASWPVSFVILEMLRLHEHSRLLRRMLEIDISYDLLLRDAREERDLAQSASRRLEVQNEVLRAAGQFTRLLAESSTRKDSDESGKP